MVGFGFITPCNTIHYTALSNANSSYKSRILTDFIGIFNLLFKVKFCSFKYLLCFVHATTLIE